MTSRINSRNRTTSRVSVTTSAVVEPTYDPSLDLSDSRNSQYIGQVM
ncbi:hypothetical protein EVB68_039 [Rhizobium phage RHph_Y2_6]|uniref:Uncharacterized protein n=2 Tax=Acanvirus TaxID=3044653 RepID=A0AAE7VMB1_9CAUD|nr:hypothetical protein PP748_gp039 [Rhizobium phage RHph_Y2_6]YP_010658345.1 hypothetical protein PP750_gp35 [Rhizobium phage RHEph16]QIG68776.1 hypothetical protein EVB68_039 [Rhizobium phage RHph_Y2_6]QXV74344.1 hypothetical protein [Rhizobium phage RHEph16]